jgi:protein-tyrosine kinase
VSDEQRRLDLVQRYADRLGQVETNVAEFLAPATSQTAPWHAPQAGFDTPTALSSKPPRVNQGTPRHPSPEPSPDDDAPYPIDLDRLERHGFIRPDGDKKTRLVEQFQIIKRPLVQKAFAVGQGTVRNGNAVMVTSARPGEGKSYVALNLAMSIASERDLSVVLLDGDFSRQSLPEMLGIKVERGLVDILLDESLDISDVLVRTTIANLSFVPAGAKRPHSTELLSSPRMGRLMRELTSRYSDRIVVIDSPPVLANTETGVLAAHAGQVIMVIEQNRTGWRMVEQSLARLSDCPEISFVLNKVGPMWDENVGASYG